MAEDNRVTRAVDAAADAADAITPAFVTPVVSVAPVAAVFATPVTSAIPAVTAPAASVSFVLPAAVPVTVIAAVSTASAAAPAAA
ncbi:hypothetical protein DL771_009772 [Monosporascus sp. 5C6A]|nr:hypothetical protein DL771_009772 [Monosporascus sp. 5C6A]